MHEKVIKLENEIKWKNIMIASSFLITTLFAFIYLNVNVVEITTAIPTFSNFFINNFWAPDFTNIATYIPIMIWSLLFAIVGTYISSFLALIFGLLISQRTNKILILRVIFRFIASFLRNIPILIWASLLVYIFGIGSIVGLLALILATLGFLARSYADAINSIDESKIEGLKSCGASHLQIVFHAILPEFIPLWINWTLFSFEINIRASAILGLVGAGGIGLLIQTNIKLFKYHEALSIIILIVILVLVVEFSTNKLRKVINSK